MSESFAELFEESLKTVDMQPGAIVTGVVIDIDNEWVTVHAGLKSEGVIPRAQFTDASGECTLNIGDEVQVALETVEFLQYGIREVDGQGVQNHNPRVAVTDNTAAVLWLNGSDTEIVSMAYDYATGEWEDADVLEKRTRLIPHDNSHQLAANASGSLLAFWGERYATRRSADGGWSKSKALPATPDLYGIDAVGLPYIVYREAGDVFVNRYDGSGWPQYKLNSEGDGGSPTLVGALDSIQGDLSVYWFSGDEMLRSSHATGDSSPPNQSAPVTTLSADVRKVKGAISYTLSLTVDRAADSYFRFTGQGTIESGGQAGDGWQTYIGPVTIKMNKRGSGEFEYYSEDGDGNREIPRTEVL